MNKMWVMAAAGSLLSVGAMAQANPAPAPVASPSASSPSTSREGLRQQMTSDMQKAGFTDVKVRPDSFLVQAKDKNGMPVTMLIDPNSVTEIVATAVPQSGANGTTAGSFTTVPNSDLLSSKVVGTDVHNNANQDIGTIKDVAYAGGSIKAYIVGVGGFLGMGDHYVAVSPSALNMSYDNNAHSWHATMNTTAAQLKAAPEFKYPA